MTDICDYLRVTQARTALTAIARGCGVELTVSMWGRVAQASEARAKRK